MLTLDKVVEVKMDGAWKAAKDASERLATYGVGTCIAVAVGDDRGKRMWLIHSGFFGHHSGALNEMLLAAKAKNRDGLKVLVFGGDIPSKELEEDVLLAQFAVKEALQAVLPDVSPEICWGEVSSAEFHFEQEGWRFEGELSGLQNW